MLGTTAAIDIYPTFRAVRQIEAFQAVERIDSLVLVNLIGMGFIGISTFFYATTLGVTQVLNLRSRLPAVWPIGVLLVIMADIQFGNITEALEFAQDTALYYHPIFELGIPLVTLGTAFFCRLLPNSNSVRPSTG